MSGQDLIPELNRVDLKSPTEDGKLSFIMNTMVPRRLEAFDDIRNDLNNRNFDTDKAYLYVNFQAGDFCGRSYKLPLSELTEFMADSLLFGTVDKEPLVEFDKNFYIDEDHNIHLLIDPAEWADNPKVSAIMEELMDESKPSEYERNKYLLMNLYRELLRADTRLDQQLNGYYNEQLDRFIPGEVQNREAADNALDFKKQDKFVILGSGDNLNSEGLPEPKAETENDAFGVHVTYNPKNSEGVLIYDGPIIDSEGTRGPVILIDHDYRFAQTITSKFDIGGIGKGQTILKGTPLETFIWQLLRGDPVIENIIYWKATDRLPIPTSTWTGLGPWGHNKTTTNDDLLSVEDPIFGWKGIFEFTIDTKDEFLMMSVPRSNSTGFKPDDQGQWIVPLLNSNKAPHGIRLNEIYLKDAPQFKVNFKTMDIRNEDESTEWGYKLYYIDEQSYYPQGQTWVVEFVPNE